MEDGRDRARRSLGRPPAGPPRDPVPVESVDDVLARHGLLAAEPADTETAAPARPTTGGRAARRRAAEERARARAASQVPSARRRAMHPATPAQQVPDGGASPIGRAVPPMHPATPAQEPDRGAPPTGRAVPHTRSTAPAQQAPDRGTAPTGRAVPHTRPSTPAQQASDSGAPFIGRAVPEAGRFTPTQQARDGGAPPVDCAVPHTRPTTPAQQTPDRGAPPVDRAVPHTRPTTPTQEPDRGAPPTGRAAPRTRPTTPAQQEPAGRAPRPDPAVPGAPATPPRTAGKEQDRLRRRLRPGPDDTGSGTPDTSESAERARRADRTSGSRARRIDETLTRLTAAHAARDTAEPPRRRAGRRRPDLGRLIAGGLAVIVLLTTTAGWAAKAWLESAVRDVAALDPAPGAGDQGGARNVLVVATDTGSAPGAATDTRSDTVTVAHVPESGGPLVALSIPIDLEVNRPPCERFDPATGGYTDETVPAEARTQLVTALAVGGPRCATRVVEQLTGLAITGYVGVDLAGLGAAVDAVSGVAVCVSHPVIDAALGPVLPDVGPATLNGTRAADFVRAADVSGEPSSQRGSIERQQQVLAGVLDAALSTTGLLDPGRLLAVAPALRALVADGVGLDQILATARSLERLDAPGVTFAAVPTAPVVNGRGNAVLRDADAAALFTALRKGTPLPEGDGAPQSGPSPADTTVQILNASERSGLAAEVGKTLSALGFVVGEVGNAQAPTQQTTIRFSPDQAAAAGLLATTVPSAVPVPDPVGTGVLQLLLGESFDGVVLAPSEPVTVRSTGTGAPAACP